MNQQKRKNPVIEFIKDCWETMVVYPTEERRLARCEDCPACFIMWEDNTTGYTEAGCHLSKGNECAGCWKSRRRIARQMAAFEEAWAIDGAYTGIIEDFGELDYIARCLSESGQPQATSELMAAHDDICRSIIAAAKVLRNMAAGKETT